MRHSLLAALAGLTLATTASATPQLLTHSGRLLGVDGEPINGERTLITALFSGPDASATQLWSESQSETLTQGYYSTIMGDSTPFPNGIFDGSVRWLGITVDGVALGARSPIYAAPYAFRAQTADLADIATNAVGDITPQSVTTDTATVGSTTEAGTVRIYDRDGDALVVRTDSTEDWNGGITIDGPTGTERAVVLTTDGTNEWWMGIDNTGPATESLAFFRQGVGFPLVLHNDGDIGVGGTQAPQARLDINGGIKTTNLGKIQVMDGWAGSAQSVPLTSDYVAAHNGETYMYVAAGPRLSSQAACASAGTNGTPNAFFDGTDDVSLGQYIFTLYDYGGAPAIIGTWTGWRSYLRTPASGVSGHVAEGQGEVNFTLRFTSGAWRVEHMAGQVAGFSWECR